LLDFQDEGFHGQSTWQPDTDPTAWLDIFREFTAVHTLRIPRGLRSPILSVLQRLDEQSVMVLPALQDLYLGGYELSGSKIEPFITKRQRSKRPVTVHSWQGMTPHGDSTPTATSSLRRSFRALIPTHRIKTSESDMLLELD
jgi:hypothetical protein